MVVLEETPHKHYSQFLMLETIPGLDAALCRLIPECDGQMGFADAGWSQQDDVLGALDEGQGGQLHELLLRRAGGKGEVVVIQRLDRRETCHAGQRRSGSGFAGFVLGFEDGFEFLCGGLARCDRGASASLDRGEDRLPRPSFLSTVWEDSRSAHDPYLRSLRRGCEPQAESTHECLADDTSDDSGSSRNPRRPTLRESTRRWLAPA